MPGELTVNLFVCYQHLNSSQLPRASKRNLSYFSMVGQKKDLAGVLHHQFFGIRFAGISCGKPFVKGQSDGPHESFIDVYLVQRQASERPHHSLAEPAEFTADQYHARALGCEFYCSAQGIGEAPIRSERSRTRRANSSTVLPPSRNIVSLGGDEFQRGLRDALLSPCAAMEALSSNKRLFQAASCADCAAVNAPHLPRSSRVVPNRAEPWRMTL